MTESTEAQHDEPATLSLSIEPTGRGETVTVIATLRTKGKADEELHRDQVNLNRANHRTKFGRAIHDKLPRFTPLEIESQLLKLRADLERSQDASDDRPSQGKELDALELTRPELVTFAIKAMSYTALAVTSTVGALVIASIAASHFTVTLTYDETTRIYDRSEDDPPPF